MKGDSQRTRRQVFPGAQEKEKKLKKKKKDKTLKAQLHEKKNLKKNGLKKRGRAVMKRPFSVRHNWALMNLTDGTELTR